MTQRISAGLASEELSIDDLEETVRQLRDTALHHRAAHLRHYVGLDAEVPLADRLISAARQLVAQCERIEDLRDRLARPAFSAVFTAHPTFALSDAVYEQLAHLATDPALEVPKLASHRRLEAPTLWHEQDLALAAILRGGMRLTRSTAHSWMPAGKNGLTRLYYQVLSFWRVGWGSIRMGAATFTGGTRLQSVSRSRKRNCGVLRRSLQNFCRRTALSSPGCVWRLTLSQRSAVQAPGPAEMPRKMLPPSRRF
ncbi:hypothetical protein [Sorlinia euscelidii]|uniref:hypothetical protein n=1 Tax=Sorlinia euscelidii TaxID=3081148 RepID=UPI00374E03F3